MQQHDNKASQMKEELVMMKESLQDACLQKELLQREKEQLGLWSTCQCTTITSIIELQLFC